MNFDGELQLHSNVGLIQIEMIAEKVSELLMPKIEIMLNSLEQKRQ